MPLIRSQKTLKTLWHDHPCLRCVRLDSIGYVAADEDTSSVRARVLLLHHFGSVPADRPGIDVRTVLANALGPRRVLDQDGRVIPQRPR
jgi:hypothetical protein